MNSKRFPCCISTFSRHFCLLAILVLAETDTFETVEGNIYVCRITILILYLPLELRSVYDTNTIYIYRSGSSPQAQSIKSISKSRPMKRSAVGRVQPAITTLSSVTKSTRMLHGRANCALVVVIVLTGPVKSRPYLLTKLFKVLRQAKGCR